jgi:hypothetical protein
MQKDSTCNQISGRVLARQLAEGVLQCQTAVRTIAAPAGSIAAIAASGEILIRMKTRPHSAKYAA